MARHFSSFLNGWHELYADLESPPQFKHWAAMSALAGAVGRKLWLYNGEGIQYTNLYVFFIGERSTGKSFMSAITVRMLKEIPGFVMASNKVTESMLIKRFVATGQQNVFHYQGTAYPNSTLFLHASEASSTFKDMHQNGGIIDLLTDLFNCGDEPWSLVSSWGKDTRAHGTENVFNPCVNLLACSTPGWLMQKVLTESNLNGGFGSRVIMVVQKGMFQRTRGAESPTPEKEMLRMRVLSDLIHISKLAGPYTVHPSWSEAETYYRSIHNPRMLDLDASDVTMANVLARKVDAYLPKIGMLIAAAERDELILRDKDAHKAWEMLTDLEGALPYAFKSYGIAEEVKHTQDLWLYLSERAAPVTLQELLLVFTKKYNSRKVTDGLYDLVKQGVL